MKAIINNKLVEVKTIENLGFNHSIGKYARVVLYENKKIIIIKNGKLWFENKPEIGIAGTYKGQ